MKWPGPQKAKPNGWEGYDEAMQRLIWSKYKPMYEAVFAGRIAREKETRRQERGRNPLYLRFGDKPEGNSVIWQPLTPASRSPREKGLSVFRARYGDEGEIVVDTSPSPASLAMFRLCVAEWRPVYLAKGEEVSWGSDREPLLEAESATFTPVPEGTVVRSSEDWGGTLAFKVVLAKLSGEGPPGWVWTASRLVVGEGGPLTPPKELPATIREVVSEVLSRSITTGVAHGSGHWKSVAAVGTWLTKDTPGSDPLVVFLFSLFHDSMRISDGMDIWHGLRAAKLARVLLEGGPLVSAAQLTTLCDALKDHDGGKTSYEPSTGVCWDADRLNLWRFGVRPKEYLLSTGAAKQRIEWAENFVQAAPARNWPALATAYGLEDADLSRPSPELEVERVEFDVSIKAPQGFECTVYYGLFNALHHLREDLYVVIADGTSEGAREFRPAHWWEHFPLAALYAEADRSIILHSRNVGKNGGWVKFVCYARAGSGAGKAARLIVPRTLEELAPMLASFQFARLRFFSKARKEMVRLIGTGGPIGERHETDRGYFPRAGTTSAYRPPAFSDKELVKATEESKKGA